MLALIHTISLSTLFTDACHLRFEAAEGRTLRASEEPQHLASVGWVTMPARPAENELNADWL
jgi:hypothetical protein